MTDIICVDDDQFFLNGCQTFINESVDGFSVVRVFAHPAPLGDVATGPLIAYLQLVAGDYTPEDPLLILLDINFGPGDTNFRLGVKVVEVIQASKIANRVRIVMLTGTSNNIVWKKLARLGVRHFIRKTEFRDNIQEGLIAARDNIRYFDGFTPADDNQLDVYQYYVCLRYSAMGFANKYHPRTDESSAGNYKSKWKKKQINDLSKLEKTSHGYRVPKPEEWSDAWVLLSLLKSRDEDLIKYVEEVCDLRITVPIR